MYSRVVSEKLLKIIHDWEDRYLIHEGKKITIECRKELCLSILERLPYEKIWMELKEGGSDRNFIIQLKHAVIRIGDNFVQKVEDDGNLKTYWSIPEDVISKYRLTSPGSSINRNVEKSIFESLIRSRNRRFAISKILS